LFTIRYTLEEFLLKAVGFGSKSSLIATLHLQSHLSRLSIFRNIKLIAPTTHLVRFCRGVHMTHDEIKTLFAANGFIMKTAELHAAKVYYAD